ncbi:uncharacterized protein LOC129601076 [Paramacrobiotus metropolitanus]|uniref:uncharacterized protein LOC129601076 n=1 Tax=Paramacrobiotus metropolitanus TaxID=2943436 RepID=UPI00244598B6|nr:uncharacterized protein LOC129601076 [Paramacrobiotus metropolitanus]
MRNISMPGCGWPERDFQYVYEADGFKYTELILHPIWLFICTVGNILNIVLLRKIHTFQAIFVTAVAHFDLLAMWGWLLRSIQVYVGYTTPGGIPSRSLNSNFSTEATRGFLVASEFFGNIGSWYSDWTLVAFSVTRLLFTIDPLRWRLSISRKQVVIAILCFLPLACTVALYPVVEYVTRDDKVATITWVGNWRQIQMIGAAIDALSSFLIIFVANMVIALILFKRQMMHKPEVECLEGKFPVRIHGKDTIISTTMTLLTASVVLYLVTTIPYLTWYILLAMEKRCMVHIGDDQFVILQSLFLQFTYAKYSLNFFVYCGVSRTFFKHFLRLITTCRWRLKANERAPTPSDATRTTRLSESAAIGNLCGNGRLCAISPMTTCSEERKGSVDGLIENCSLQECCKSLTLRDERYPDVTS